MKQRKNLQFHKKHRIMSMLLVLALFMLSLIWIKEGYVYADGDAEEESTASQGEGIKNVSQNLLKDEHGRIVFWEWTKVTPSNYMDLFVRGDKHFHTGTFYASMLVYHDSDMNPMGFISTYADKDHIFNGPDQLAYTSDFDTLGGGDNAKIDAIYKTLDEGSGKNGNPKTTATFEKTISNYIKLDSDSTLLNNNKELFKADKFYTSGTSMGVLYFSPVNRGKVYDFAGEMNVTETGVPYATMQIALSRASAKGNSGDMSYNSIGKNMNGNRDFFLVEPYKSTDTRIIVKDNMEELMSYNQSLISIRGGGTSDDDKYWEPKNNASAARSFETPDVTNDVAFYGMYAYGGDEKSDKWMFMGKDCWNYLAVKDGYLVNISMGYFGEYIRERWQNTLTDVKKINEGLMKGLLTAKDSSIYNVFTWYIGKPHVFASVKGQGGDEITGIGGTTTIGKGDTLILKDTSYLDIDGNEAIAEGVVLPEKSSIVIEEGGVLSIEGNLINNGRIINKGGTILIKDGGCVSTFGTTDEGSIECKPAASGQSGSIIIMPGGKLYSLVDDSKLTPSVQLSSKYMKGFRKLETAALTLSGGSSLVNYGTFVTNLTRMDNSSIIENRKDAVAYIGYSKVDSGALLYYSKVTKEEIDNIAQVADADRRERSGILPVYVKTEDGIDGQRGTVLTESTATLKLSMSQSVAGQNARYKTPEY